MNVAVIGSGGREHAIAVKSLTSELVDEVHVIPGNSGMLLTKGLRIHLCWDGSFPSLETYIKEHTIDLIIVGNEAYLLEGITDYFVKRNILIFGPLKNGAKLEYSKDFAKQFMKKYNIPTADYRTFNRYEEANRYMKSVQGPLVIKQDGLALGKGVLVTEDRREGDIFLKESFNVTKKIVFEEYLVGKEFSLLTFVNQEYYNCMAPVRDYKRAFDGDKGLNTGGMGAYTPVEYITEDDLKIIDEYIVRPTIQGLLDENISFTGILYFGLMKTREGIKVIEYNTRFGDPETEVLLESMESDLIGAIASTFTKTFFPLRFKSGTTLGVCMASIGYPVNCEKGGKVELNESITSYSMALRNEGSSFYVDGGRVLFVVQHGDSLEKAREACYKDVKTIKSSALFYRRDIGL